jgi:lactocepin
MSLKSWKKQRRLAAYALASTLVLSNLGYVAPATAQATTAAKKDYTPMIEQFKKHLEVNNGKKLEGKNKIKADFKASEKVRVIVEVEGQTPVEYATKQGKLYKELSETTKASLTSKLEKIQKTVKDKIKAKGVNVIYKSKFSTAFNGFSGEVLFGELSKLEEVEGVKNVYLANEYKRPEEKPDMKNSKSLIQTSETWADAGLKGEGMVVSVIDTGVDPTHKDFVLTDNETAELTADEVAAIASKNGLKGTFFTEKVPYGYNYYDQNDTILDKGPSASMHGMHVAGTVAANGDEENGGIKGVAPEAQVLAMKVFSNDPLYPSTWSDVYLAAIDDSIKLGADVLNMSLGDVAAFYNEQSAEDIAIARATENGIVAAVSAGNSGTISYGWDNPYYKNPDIGVVGAPGLNPDSIQVAAAGNLAYLYQHVFTVDGAQNIAGAGYGIDDWTKLAAENETLELVSLNGGLGYPEDYENIDAVGKVVVVPRGELSFYDKTVYAAEAGAVGIIVYNSDSPVFYKNQGGWDIPFMKISRSEGLALEEAIAAGNTTLHVNLADQQQDPETGRMTDFTSWGTTPSLELKPEITAPGGKIISTLNNDEYGEMSGTSMAAPHVAGGAALVQQFLQEDSRFETLSVSERTKLAKVLLMNTAEVIDDVYGQPFSPRRQGAGMMQTYNAVKTPVYVVNNSTDEAKVELKDFTATTFEMTLTAKNISTEDVTYSVKTDVLADTLQQNGEGEAYNALRAGNLEGVMVDGPDTITVPAGGSKEFTIKVDLSEAKIPALDEEGNQTLVDLQEDIFVEGFVRLEDADKLVVGKKELSPDLAIPYVGFYGEWDRPSILDGFKDLGESRFFDLQGMFDEVDEEGNVLEVPVGDMLSSDWFTSPVPEKGFYAISPNGDWMNDDINALPSFMRNAAEVQFNVLDENGNFLRRVKLEKDVYKSFYDAGAGIPFSYNLDRTWDGTVKGKTVKDGLYYYQIKSVIDYNGADYQTKDIPVYVDTAAPKVEASFDPETSVVSWKTVEEGSGVLSYGIFVNGEFVGETTETSYELLEVSEGSVIDVLAVDYAYNFDGTTVAVGDAGDAEPVIYVDDWATVPYGTYNTKEIPVTGIVEDLGLSSLTVNGKEVKFAYAGLGMYTFSTTTAFEKDGFYDIIVKAVDKSGQTTSISRKVFIDTTKADVKVSTPKYVPVSAEEVTLKLNLKDNFNYLSLLVNDNHEYEKAIVSPVDVLVPANDNVEVKVPVELGQNKIILKLHDLGGNETVKEIVVNRENFNGWSLEDGSWYYYKNSVRASGWVKDKQWYYLSEDGKMQTGWVSYKNQWYFLNKTGAMATGWVLDHNKWYYLNHEGVMQTGWVLVNGKWYFLDNTGAMKTGWLLEGSTWYFLNNGGDMAVGWKLVNGKWYYFYSSGKMAANTTVGAYKLGNDGAWIQ